MREDLSIVKILIATAFAGVLLSAGTGLAQADETMGCGPGQYGCTAPGGGRNDEGQIVQPQRRPHPPTNSQPAPSPIRLP